MGWNREGSAGSDLFLKLEIKRSLIQVSDDMSERKQDVEKEYKVKENANDN